MTEEEIAEQAKKLIQRFDKTRIIGAGGEWSGSARQGFMFNPRPRGPAAEAPVVSGACCYCDGTCAVVARSVCEGAGGTYQGDGTVCSPGLCPTGACCIGETCTIVTEDCCINAGGIYQGDDTTCDPNPCGGNTGACCDPFTNICSIETREDCEASFGTYLGDGTTCDGVDCACCPMFTDITTVTFSVVVTGCSLTDPITFGPETWTKVAGPSLGDHEFTTNGCAFTARNLNSLCVYEDNTSVRIIDRGDCTSTDVDSFAVDFATACGPYVLASGCVKDCNSPNDTICASTPDFVYITPGSNTIIFDDGTGITFTFTVVLA